MTRDSRSPQRPTRSRLKDFYGLASAKDEIKPIEKNLPPNPLDIDCEAFDPPKFMHKLLSEKDLSGLLKFQCDLIIEIKRLDGDMKTLVYENYEKFISASDIINKMKSDIGTMETEMSNLRGSIDTLSQNSNQIAAAFVEKRAKIRELGGRSVLLRKIQFIFDLPSRLKTCLNKFQYSEAVRYHFRASGIFSRYGEISGLRAVESQCEPILREIARRVRGKMRQEKLSIKEISECVNSLLALKESPVDLALEYLKLATARLQNLRKDAMAQELVPHEKIVVKVAASTPLPDSAPTSPVDDMISPRDFPLPAQPTEPLRSVLDNDHPDVLRTCILNSQYLKELALFIDTFEHLFLRTRDGAAWGEIWLEPHGKTFAVNFAEEDRVKVHSELTTCAKSLVQDYFNTIEEFLMLKDVKTISALDLPIGNYLAILELIYVNMGNLSGPSKLVQSLLQERSEKLSVDFLKRFVRSLFTTAQNEFFARLGVIDQPVENPVDSIRGRVGLINEWLVSTVFPTCHRHFEKFETSTASFMEFYTDVFRELVQTETTMFWLSLLDEFILSAQNGNYRIDKPPPGTQTSRCIKVLLMAKLSQIFADITIDKSFTILLKKTVNADSSGSTDSLTGVMIEIIDKVKDSSKKLLVRFVDLASVEMVTMVRRSLETRNWLSMKEPRKVSKLWEQIEEDLVIIDNDLNQIYDNQFQPDIPERNSLRSSEASFHPTNLSYSNKFSPTAYSNSALYSQSNISQRTTSIGHKRFAEQNSTGVGGYLSNIDKLFSERVEIYSKKLIDSKPTIMLSLIKIIVKAFSEFCRLTVFGKSGYQQIQIDVEFIRIHFWKFITEEKLMNGMLDDVLTSALTMCIEPVPLESSVIVKILEKSGEQ